MKRMKRLLMCVCMLPAWTQAQMPDEDVDAYGVRNGMDFSWRYYHEQMQRFPDRLGIICYNAYLLDKVGLHKEGEQFMLRCAEQGSTSAMIYLALLYEQGFVGKPDPARATRWIKLAAKQGNPVAQYHYGMALMKGKGIKTNPSEARKWLRLSAEQGEIEAINYLSSEQQ